MVGELGLNGMWRPGAGMRHYSVWHPLPFLDGLRPLALTLLPKYVVQSMFLAWIAEQPIRHDACLVVVPRGCGTASRRLPPRKRGQVNRVGVVVLERGGLLQWMKGRSSPTRLWKRWFVLAVNGLVDVVGDGHLFSFDV